MEYKIKVGKPPNFMKIVQAFPKAANADTIFAYDNTIYVSSPAIVLSPALIKHERVHIRRQNEIGVEVWWDNYINDKDFRYEEELLAHKAEFLELIQDKKEKRVITSRLSIVAQRLMAPLYKFNITYEKARRDIGGSYAN